jgi:cytoskeletal protein RodZ
MDSRKNHRTPIALVLAVGLLGLGGVSLAAASTVPSLVREDVVVRTNPSTNLTPNDPGAMPTDAPSDTTSAEPTESSTTEPVTTTQPTGTTEPEPVETTSATVVPTRNPVQATDSADPVDPLPAEPVVEETTFNPVEPTTDTPVPPRPTN